ncbi:cellulose biosynthesis protein BcsP [Cupriavidus sp. YAF13]|uniref:cellulose biosynthesis protein BcsP n=1 Tax=Cupriavidus sp. YAF13 TaxID=3233075 RepID=UPI003F93755B
MSQSDDLSKLFQRFGGKAESYKEIVREDAATQARERWPLLTSVRVDRAAVVPPVQPAAPHAHDVAGPAAAQAAPPAPLWRAALPAGELAPAAEPARAAEAPAAQVVPPAVTVAPVAPAATGAPPSAMRPLFRTPEGMAPAASASMPRSTPEVAAALPPVAAVANPVVAPEPEPARIWSPAAPAGAAAPPAEPARAADTELSKVFARLEGRQEPATTSERAPARRSFLDRLNRS